MYQAVERDDARVLTAQNGLPDLTSTDEFWALVNTFPDGCPIPTQIIQLGLLIKHLEPIHDDVEVEMSDTNIDSATEAVVSTKTKKLILEILVKCTDHLDSSEKKRVGRFCEITKLSQKNESGVMESEIIGAAKNNPRPDTQSFAFTKKSGEQRKDEISSPSSTTSEPTISEDTEVGSQTHGSSEPQPKRHCCEYCGREYSSPAGLRGHQRKCIKKRTADSSQPKKSHRSKSKKKTKRSTERYQCKHCDREFKKKKTMKYHQRKCGESSRDKSTSRLTTSEWRPDHGIKIRKNRGSERKTGLSPFSDADLIKDTIAKSASKKNKDEDDQ